MKNQKKCEIFSVRLRALMSLKRCRGIDVAKSMGVRPATVTGWRNAEYLPDSEKWEKLSSVLGVSEYELFRGISTELIQKKNPESESVGEDKVLYKQSDFYNVDNPRFMDIAKEFMLPRESNGSIREEIEQDLKCYLDAAENVGALNVAAINIRKHLKIEEFELLNERIKK